MADLNVPVTGVATAKADPGISQVPAVSRDPQLTDDSVKVGSEPAGVEVVAPAAAQVAIKAPTKTVRTPKPKAPAAKPVLQKAANAVKTAKVAKPALKRAAPKPDRISVTNKASNLSQLKDQIMATKTPDFAKNIQDAIADVQGKAKVAFEKSTASLGEVTEFTKGNVEALVEAGKIFAAGAQDLGSTYVAESRTAFETLTTDVKELASAKNPTDFFQLQGDLARRNFDTAVAAGSKNSEALLKLFSEAFAPITGRVSLAVDKVKQAA